MIYFNQTKLYYVTVVDGKDNESFLNGELNQNKKRVISFTTTQKIRSVL